MSTVFVINSSRYESGIWHEFKSLWIWHLEYVIIFFFVVHLSKPSSPLISYWSVVFPIFQHITPIPWLQGCHWNLNFVDSIFGIIFINILKMSIFATKRTFWQREPYCIVVKSIVCSFLLKRTFDCCAMSQACARASRIGCIQAAINKDFNASQFTIKYESKYVCFTTICSYLCWWKLMVWCRGKYWYIMSDFDANIAIKFILNARLSEYQWPDNTPTWFYPPVHTFYTKYLQNIGTGNILILSDSNGPWLLKKVQVPCQ